MKKFEFLSRTEFITNLSFSQIFVEFFTRRFEAEKMQCNSTVPYPAIFGGSRLKPLCSLRVWRRYKLSPVGSSGEAPETLAIMHSK